MAVCIVGYVGSHHDLGGVGGVVRGLLIPHTCGHPRLRQFYTTLPKLGSSSQVLRGGGLC